MQHQHRAWNPREIRCNACKQNIPKGAWKCNKCGEYQGWRRSTSTIVYTLLGATLSTTTIITIFSLFSCTAPNSRVELSSIYAFNDNFSFTVTNSGERSALIRNIEFTLRFGRGEGFAGMLVQYFLPGGSSEEPTVIKAGETQTYKMNFTKDRLGVAEYTASFLGQISSRIPVGASKGTCEMRLNIDDFTSTRRRVVRVIPCLDIAPGIEHWLLRRQ